MIINDVCEVVSRKPVVFNNNLVIYYTIIKDHLAVNQILKLSFAFWNLHANDERLTLRFFLFYLIGIIVLGAKSIVLCLRILLSANLYSHFC